MAPPKSLKGRVGVLVGVGETVVITVVAGPPGSGKTLAVAQWASSAATPAVAWLTCEAAHASARQLAVDIVASLQPLGDHIGDFSTPGYMGGAVPIPTALVKVTVSPVAGDNTANIQNAINTVSALPPDVSGDRPLPIPRNFHQALHA